MNQSDQQAHGRAVDSLLNYETVKYFGNEQHESDRFSGAMKRYEDAAVRSRTSLSVLNVGQGFIIAVGLTLVMYLAAKGIDQGHIVLTAVGEEGVKNITVDIMEEGEKVVEDQSICRDVNMMIGNVWR